MNTHNIFGLKSRAQPDKKVLPIKYRTKLEHVLHCICLSTGFRKKSILKKEIALQVAVCLSVCTYYVQAAGPITKAAGLLILYSHDTWDSIACL